MDIAVPWIVGSALISSCALAEILAASAPMRFTIAERLFSGESNRAASIWIGSMVGLFFSPAMPIAAWTASWAVKANLSSLIL